MDTRLKKISYSPVVKGVAFLLAILCFGLSVTVFANVMRNTNGLEALSERSYIHSMELYNYEQNFYTGLNNLLKYKDEDNIRKGNTINKAEFESRKRDMFYEWYSSVDENVRQNNVRQSGDGNNNAAKSKIDEYQLLKERFEGENSDKINEMYNSMIDRELQDYFSLLQRVKNKEGLQYYATNGENTYTNCNQTERGYFVGFKAYYLFDKEGISFSPQLKTTANISYLSETTQRTIGSKIYIAVTDEFLTKMQGEWDKQHAYLQNGVVRISLNVFIMLAALLYLLWRAGRKAFDEGVHLMAVDRLYTDVNILAVFGIFVFWALTIREFFESKFLDYPITSLADARPDFWATVLVSLLFCSMALMLLLSLVRHLKNKTLVRHSMIYTVLAKLRNTIKTIFNAGPAYIRIAAVVLAGEAVVFILTAIMIGSRSEIGVLLFFVLCALSVAAIYYMIVKLKPFIEIVKGVQEIKNGKVDHVIEVKGDGALSGLANDINTIADGLKNAVLKETKAERMKSELITNVSHDLKTPLTSIINYVDLLSKEKLMPDVANDYVAILKQKSEKLKNLTQDLFEISRVQSGNVSVELEKIDISVLVRQSLAELDEQISASGLDFRLNIQDENTGILGDGKRLSRVFENLVSNILKYSLENTRVYINVFSADNRVFIEFKNIANYEMDFKEDEILERFVRGDKARTTDGSGLGLAIAESYVTACGGTLKISVDGDLFKAVIEFDSGDGSR